MRWARAGNPVPLDPERNDAACLLDALRAVAAQAVVVGHGISFFKVYSALDYPAAPYMQNLAVVCFFLVSGFLIAHTLRRRLTSDPDYPFRAYFAARFARIYSGYVPALLFVAAVDGYLIAHAAGYPHESAYSPIVFVGNLFMLEDAGWPFRSVLGVSMTSFGSGRPFWTLAIEMWIYLFVGAAVLFRKRLTVLRIALLLVFSVVPLRNLWAGRGAGLFGVWLLGAGVEAVLARGWLARARSWTLAAAGLGAGVVYVALVWRAKEAYLRISYPLAAVVLLCVLALSLRARWTVSRPRLRSIVSFVAGYSYTLYLTHYTVMTAFVLLAAPWAPIVSFWTSVVVANAVAVGIAHFTERRHKALASRLTRALGPVRAVPAG